MSISVVINGEPHEFAQPISVAELVQKLELKPELVAVERNRQLVPRREYASTTVDHQDQLEIVTLVGGG